MSLRICKFFYPEIVEKIIKIFAGSVTAKIGDFSESIVICQIKSRN